MKTYLEKIELANGRSVFLKGLILRPAYGSLQEGRPERAVNQFLLMSALHSAAKMWPECGSILLNGNGLVEDLDIELPGVHCTANFISMDAARDAQKMASGLTLVWYQSEMTSGLPQRVLDAIRVLDWANVATDFDW